MALNLRAPFLLSQAAAPHLRRARGAIVNIADLAAFETWPDYLVHGLSKSRRRAPDARAGARARAGGPRRSRRARNGAPAGQVERGRRRAASRDDAAAAQRQSGGRARMPSSSSSARTTSPERRSSSTAGATFVSERCERRFPPRLHFIIMGTTYNYDVVIIGAGPAGMCAGLYAGRAMLKAVVLEKRFSRRRAAEHRAHRGLSRLRAHPRSRSRPEVRRSRRQVRRGVPDGRRTSIASNDAPTGHSPRARIQATSTTRPP